MNKYFSVYLDALRFFSAAFVVLFHIKKVQLVSPEIGRLIPDHGHDFVMVFFVLSGYLIAYSVDRKKAAGYKEYFLDRSSRIYSVAIPVLVLCWILSLFHGDLDPAGYFSTAFERPLVTFISNFLFFSHAWDSLYLLFWNSPYWSLSYEVVYYVLFGFFVFLRSPLRWVVLVLLALGIGPKVLLLLPCWLAGVLAYRYRDAWRPSQSFALFLGFFAPPLVLVLLHFLHFGPWTRSFLSNSLGEHYSSLVWSKDFLVDYVTATLVALHLFSVRHLNLHFSGGVSAFVKQGADMSYSLYLAHMPVLYALTVIFGEQRQTLGVFLVTLISTFGFCWGFAQMTEAKRIWLRALLARLIGVPARGQ